MSEPKRTTTARGHTVRGAPGQETANVSVRLTLGEIERVRRLAVIQDRKLSAMCRRLILRGLPPVGERDPDREE